MSSAKDRFTATLNQVREHEVMDHRPLALNLHIVDSMGPRDEVVEGERLTGGAHPKNDIVVRDPKVSRMHFELRPDDSGANLRDLCSRNGTWVQGARINEAWIEPGTTLRLGDSTITINGVRSVPVPVAIDDQFEGLYGRCSKMGELFAQLKQLKLVEQLDVLLQGDSGTGKELVAKSLRQEGTPFVVVDCATLGNGVPEAILFGHKKGSFTDAFEDRPGLLEEADGGTLFFDEIGELPLSLQPLLLRALQEREVRRVGETHYRSFKARIVAATNRDLVKMVGTGEFREDLYYRLSVMPLHIPTLRERGISDITFLAHRFVDEFAKTRSDDLRPQLDKAASSVLGEHTWPGNVRELRHVLLRATLLTQTDTITANDLVITRRTPSHGAHGGDIERLESALSLCILDAREEFERVYVGRHIRAAKGNKSETARQIGMSRSAFFGMLKRLFPNGLTGPHSGATGSGA